MKTVIQRQSTVTSGIDWCCWKADATSLSKKLGAASFTEARGRLCIVKVLWVSRDAANCKMSEFAEIRSVRHEKFSWHLQLFFWTNIVRNADNKEHFAVIWRMYDVFLSYCSLMELCYAICYYALLQMEKIYIWNVESRKFQISIGTQTIYVIFSINK